MKFRMAEGSIIQGPDKISMLSEFPSNKNRYYLSSRSLTRLSRAGMQSTFWEWLCISRHVIWVAYLANNKSEFIRRVWGLAVLKLT